MSVSLSMMLTSTLRARSACEAIWPKRPKPITSTLPTSPSATSTSSIDGAAVLRSSRVTTSMTSGVRAIEAITTVVKTAFVCGSKRPRAPALL